MAITSAFKQKFSERLKYKNYSEDVVIISEASVGNNISIYTVKSKNNVTFQRVPGMSGLTDTGKLGFIAGDRGRPMLMGTRKKAQGIKTTTTTTVTTYPPEAPVVTIEAAVEWDIKLTATATCFGSSTEQKDDFVKAT